MRQCARALILISAMKIGKSCILSLKQRRACPNGLDIEGYFWISKLVSWLRVETLIRGLCRWAERYEKETQNEMGKATYVRSMENIS